MSVSLDDKGIHSLDATMGLAQAQESYYGMVIKSKATPEQIVSYTHFLQIS